ncbi:hypothetical protein Esti_003222 [Eimeria stiedai]
MRAAQGLPLRVCWCCYWYCCCSRRIDQWSPSSTRELLLLPEALADVEVHVLSVRMTRPLQVVEGEPRSPRVFLALAQPEGPANQVYLKVQPDGGVLFYMASSLDRPLQQVFDYYAYNGYLTEAHFIKMCVNNKLFPADKNPDALKHIFKSVAKEERCVEYEAFLQLLHLLSRLKFRKANIPEQDAVNALVAHLLQMAPRRQRRHRLVNCGVQATPEFEDKECDVRLECKDAAVDCEPRLQDQIIQEQVKTSEASVAAAVETRDAGEQAGLFDSKNAEVQVDVQKKVDEEEKARRRQEEEEKKRKEEEERRQKEEEERKQREAEETTKREAAAKERLKKFKDVQTETVFSGDDAIKFDDCPEQPEVLTALRGEQDSLLYRAFCLYSEFVPEACENLLSELNCALLFRDGDLMAVPLHPAIRGLPPALAREYFNKVVSRRKSEEPTTAEKDAAAAAEAPGVPPAGHPGSEARLNYREFKALVFLASQWICQTQNSYWSFVRIVRDTLLPGLFRAQPWQQQASVELQGLAYRGKQATSGTSSEAPEVETTEQTATSYSSSSSSSEGEGSTSSSSTDQRSRSSQEEDRSRVAAGSRLCSGRGRGRRGGDGGRRGKLLEWKLFFTKKKRKVLSQLTPRTAAAPPASQETSIPSSAAPTPQQGGPHQGGLPPCELGEQGPLAGGPCSTNPSSRRELQLSPRGGRVSLGVERQ